MDGVCNRNKHWNSATGSWQLNRLPPAYHMRQVSLCKRLRVGDERECFCIRVTSALGFRVSLNDAGALKCVPSRSTCSSPCMASVLSHVSTSCARAHTHTHLSAPRACHSPERHWGCRAACAACCKAGWQTALQTCRCCPHGPKHSPETGRRGGER